jgi:SDR family mycofactocin-dependent oxidoreductase
VAIVTGAARGIGAATVARLDAEGWSIVAVDRAGDDPRLPYPMGSAEELTAVVGAARSAVACAGDVTDLDAMQHAVDAARERFGGVDAVIAVAGVIAGGVPAWEVPLEQERAVLEVDLGAVLVAARVGIPAILERPAPRSGRFVAVSSAAATRGLPMLAAYCAAKAGVAGFVRALAVELRGTGVTANAVAPGSTDTAILAESARLYSLAGAASFASQQPIERLLEPDEIAAMIVWLCGADAGGITGGLFPVDGGLSV